MNTFDFVQVGIPIEYINDPNYDLLGVNSDIGLKSYALKARGRSRLSGHDIKLTFNLTDSIATVGFSAKILGQRYPDLISSDNIRDCLSLFSSKYGLCQSIDIENALIWGSCNRLEVTKDIGIELNTNDYQRLNNLVVDTYKWKTLTNRGVVNKNGFGVMRSDDSESLILYGKREEMEMDKHIEYVKEYGLEGKFNGLTRVESKLNSKKGIRKRFGTDSLRDILASERKPQIEILDEVFSSVNQSQLVQDNFIKSQRDRERLSYAREFDLDIRAISDDLRRRAGKNWKRELEPIIKIANGESSDMIETLQIVDKIKGLL